jgi:rRNA maturation endonuclease Nob1
MDISIIPNAKPSEPWEYFCRGCKQLRLSYCEKSAKPMCTNCGSTDLVTGAVGTVEREA